jgi:exosortase K
MNQKGKRGAQIFAVLLCALGLKLYYSAASPDQLRWILGPTTWLVELLSGQSFSFESHAGYMSSDHSFLIAASCAGVNFLITAFLMLTLKAIFSSRMSSFTLQLIPISALMSYLATIIANTVRICIALELQKRNVSPLSAGQLHRLEGIMIYFGFLLLLFLLTEKTDSKGFWDLLRQLRFPLLIYYVVTLVLPVTNGAYKQGWDFWEHSGFVLVVPLLVSFLVVMFRCVWMNLGRPMRSRYGLKV